MIIIIIKITIKTVVAVKIVMRQIKHEQSNDDQDNHYIYIFKNRDIIIIKKTYE